MVVPTPMNDGEHALFIQVLEANHRWMEAESRSGFDHRSLRYSKLRSRTIVGGIAVRHDGVQAIVAAGQLDDYENAFRMLLNARALQRLSGEHRRRAAENNRQPGAYPKAIQSSREEIPARTPAARMR